MHNSDRIKEILEDMMPRLAWVKSVESIRCLDLHSVEVIWSRLDGKMDTFDVSYGEVEDAKDVRGFMALVARKCNVETLDELKAFAKKELNEQYMAEASKRKMTVEQRVTACDKCDKIMPDGMADGTACPSCEGGKVYKWIITQPRMPMPGVSGTKRKACDEPHRD